MKKLAFRFSLFNFSDPTGLLNEKLDPFQTAYQILMKFHFKTTKVDFLLANGACDSLAYSRSTTFCSKENDRLFFHQATGTMTYENTSACRIELIILIWLL